MKLEILGVEYDICETTGNEEPRLANADGWCGAYEKQILIEKDFFQHEQGGDVGYARTEKLKLIKRHELIHAFFYETGLDGYSNNEQLVMWIARQFPKMLEVFTKADAL